MKPSILNLLKLVKVPDRRFLIFVLILRLILNFLDLLALAGVGFLALALGSSSLSSNDPNVIVLPIFGEISITANGAITLALLVTLLFIVKSSAAVGINFLSAHRIAKIETQASSEILSNIFDSGLEISGHARSIASTQNLVITSTRALFTELLTASFVVVSESALLAIILAGFLVVNPVATVAMALYLSLIVLVLNWFVDRRLKYQSIRSYNSASGALAATQDLHYVQRESKLAHTTSFWVQRVIQRKFEAADSAALVLNLSSLPRYVIESGLIVGIFGFIGGVVFFSDLASQALTIGVFLAGGLRLIASVVPLQGALNLQKQSAVQGEFAFRELREIGRKTKVKTHSVVTKHSANLGKLDLEFDNVSLRAQDGFTIIDQMTFKLSEGGKYAFVGPSGAGKSSIFEVALGFRSPSEGRVLFGQVPVADLHPSDKAHFAYVPQRPLLAHASLFENVSLGRSQFENSRDKVTRALDAAGLSYLLERLPHGLDTFIPGDSHLLSGGEIQRLGIARAIFDEPKVLFLDEATSALDAETELLISKTLDGFRGRMTVVLIAHRLSTVQNADQILYIEKGRLLGSGTYEELLGTNAAFADAVAILKTS